MMTSALDRANRAKGKHGTFLKTMDASGMGFDS